MPFPNFYLAGAPKCGTTAISVYLREHPQVFFSNPKEPCYWSDDMPGIRESYGIVSLEKYLSLFADAGPHHSAIGEGSTNYLISETAFGNLLQLNPAARIIVMLRNPVDLVHSLYNHNFLSGWDTEPNLENAWARQSERANSIGIPKACLNPVMLQYRAVGSLGSQVRRAMDVVPTDQLLIVLFDDFCDSPKSVYCRITSFLNLPDDNRSEFPAVNEAMAPRSLWLTRLMQSSTIRGLTKTLKRSLKGPFYDVANHAKKSLSMKKKAKAELDHDFRKELAMEFAGEVAMLEELLRRDLPRWRV